LGLLGILVFRPLISAILTADEIAVDDIGGDLSATIPIGESDDAQTRLTLVAEAKLTGHEGDTFYELGFHFELVPLAHPDELENPPDIEELWTAAAVAPYKPVELEGQLLSQVCECYKAIVKKAYECPIYRVSYGVIDPENPPHRHEILTNLLEDEGYEIADEGTDELGRRFWLMRPKV
jgi:hypothetical protein